MFHVGKDFSPANIAKILQPFKDKEILAQREYFDFLKKKEDIIDKAAKVAAAQQELVIPDQLPEAGKKVS